VRVDRHGGPLMRAETGQAVLASTAPVGPPLSSLVSRLAARRPPTTTAQAAATGTPSPARAPMTRPSLLPQPAAVRARPQLDLVGAHEPEPQLPGRDRARSTLDGPVPGVVLLAAHGGAGVSSLLRAGLAATGAVDGQRRWPAAGRVRLVARTSTAGLERVRDLARQDASRPGHADLVGLVLVADAPGRLPARIAALADLVSGAFPRCWQLPWLAEWRLAAATEPLPVHPQVARLSADLHTLTASARNDGTTARAGAGPAVRADHIRPDLRGVLL
jgi:hypothetical protein